MIKVAIFEDNHLLRDMLFQLINGTEGFYCSGSFADAEQLKYKIEKSSPDVVLMDIDLPGISGIEAVKLIKEKFPEIQILMQTIFEDDEKIYNSICAGASGYLLKNTPPAKLLEAIKDLTEGGAPMSSAVARKVLSAFRKQPFTKTQNFDLSSREIEVLQSIVQGMSYKLVADTYGISLDTIRFHIKNIYKKLQVHSKSEAIIKALKNKIV